jgi:tetratricopeptide (TPR) repeat protein
MTLNTVEDLFTRGQLRYALLPNILRGLAIALVQGYLSEDDIGKVLDSAVISGLVDDAVLELVLRDLHANLNFASKEMTFRYAELTYKLARKHESLWATDFLHLLVSLATSIGMAEKASSLAQDGIQALGKHLGANHLIDLYDALGRALYEQGDYLRAIPAFESGIAYARSTDEAHKEWDLLTSVVACHYLRGDYINSLQTATDQALPVAIKLGEPKSLSKTYGDIGNALLSLNRRSESRLYFEKALDAAIQSEDEEAQSNWLGNLGNICLFEGRLKEAENYQLRALELSRKIGNPSSQISDLSNLSQVFWSGKQWDDAIRLLGDAIHVAEVNNLSEEANHRREILRELHLALGHYYQALALENIIHPRPEIPRSLPLSNSEESKPNEIADAEDQEFSRRFDEKMRSRDFAGARKMAEDLISKNPGNWKGYFQLGLFLNETGEYRSSIKAYEEALRRNPKSPIIYHNLLNSWAAIGDLETPRAELENLVANDPYDAGLRTSLGRLYGMLKLHDEAIREVREALRLDPKNYIYHLTLCQELYEKGDSLLRVSWISAWAYFEECIAGFQRLVDMDESRRASTWTIAGEYFLQVAQRSYFTNPPLTAQMSDQELHLWVQAIVYFKRAMQIAPHLHRPRRGYDGALQFLKETGHLVTFTQAGKTFREMGEYDLAIQFLEFAIQQSEPRLKAGLSDEISKSIESRSMLAAPYYELALAYLNSDRDSDSNLVRAKSLLETSANLCPEDTEYIGTLRHLIRYNG